MYSSIHQYPASRTSSKRANRCWSSYFLTEGPIEAFDLDVLVGLAGLRGMSWTWQRLGMGALHLEVANRSAACRAPSNNS